MFKNIIIILCVGVIGYSYMNNVSVKTMYNQAYKKAADYSVSFQSPVTVSDNSGWSVIRTIETIEIYE